MIFKMHRNRIPFQIFLSKHKEKTFHEIGDSFGNVKNSIHLTRTKDACNMNLVVSGPFVTDTGRSNDDDLLLGASTSPTYKESCQSSDRRRRRKDYQK